MEETMQSPIRFIVGVGNSSILVIYEKDDQSAGSLYIVVGSSVWDLITFTDGPQSTVEWTRKSKRWVVSRVTLSRRYSLSRG